jgi:hypothetical protein
MSSVDKKRSATTAFGSGVAVFDDIRHQKECKKRKTAEQTRQQALQELKANRAKKTQGGSQINSSGGEGDVTLKNSKGAVVAVAVKEEAVTIEKSPAVIDHSLASPSAALKLPEKVKGFSKTAAPSGPIITPGTKELRILHALQKGVARPIVRKPAVVAPTHNSKAKTSLSTTTPPFATTTTKQMRPPHRTATASSAHKGEPRTICKVTASKQKSSIAVSSIKPRVDAVSKRSAVAQDAHKKDVTSVKGVSSGGVKGQGKIEEKRRLSSHAVEPANRYKLSATSRTKKRG